MHRYTGQDDVVLGTPFAGRNRAEFEEMVGYFINPLPLRLDLSGDPSFQELVRLLQEVTRERPMRLLAVPRAPVGFPQPRLHLHQIQEPRSTPRRRDRTGRDMVGRVADHDGGEVGEPDAGEAVALGSVLVIRTTWSVAGSNRPKLGSTSIAPA